MKRVGEKKDLLISFCIALWITILLFSMFYMPVLAAELTIEDEEKEGDYWGKGWVVKAYVKGWYYYEPDTGWTADTFHHTYHMSTVKATWGWTIVDAVWEFKGRLWTSVVYKEDGHFRGVVWDNYCKEVHYAVTYTWAHFKRWGQDKYAAAIAGILAPGGWV